MNNNSLKKPVVGVGGSNIFPSSYFDSPEMYEAVLEEETSRLFHGPKRRLKIYSSERHSLARAIEEDDQKYAYYNAALMKAENATTTILSIFDTLEKRVRDLDSLILPVHRITSENTRIHSNIAATTRITSESLEKLAIAQKMKPIISQGLNDQNFEIYLEALDSIQSAIQFLRKNPEFLVHRPLSKTLESLANDASKSCTEFYESKLSVSSKPFNPTVVLTQGSSNSPRLEPISNNIRLMLREIALRLETAEYRKKYHSIRFNTLAASVSKWFVPRGYKNNRDDPSIDEGALEISKPTKTGSSRRYERGTHPYVHLTVYLAQILEAERLLVDDLIDRANTASVFQPLIEPLIAGYVKTGEETFKRLKKRLSVMLSKKGKSSADSQEDEDSIFELIDIIEAMSAEEAAYRELLASSTRLLASVLSLREAMQKTACSWFEQFKTSLRKSTKVTSKQIPPTATVVELTSNTLNYLKRMFDYESTIERLFVWSESHPAKSPRGTNSNTGVGGGGEGAEPRSDLFNLAFNDDYNNNHNPYQAKKSRLSSYVAEILELLQASLADMSKAYKSESSSSIFLVNNYGYILERARDMSTIVGLEFIYKYEQNVQTCRQTYLDSSIAKPVAVLEKALKMGLPIKHEGLTPKEKKPIKQAFHAFNTEFEAVAKTARKLSIPNSKERERIRSLVVGAVVELYTEFHDRYWPIKFTTKVPKYFIYSPPGKLSDVIDKEFFVE